MRLRTPTVLLVDSDPDSLVIYRLILEHGGYRVLEAADVREGFRLACEHQPNLIVLEPFQSRAGGRLVEAFRSDPRTSALPLLIVTAVPFLLEEFNLLDAAEEFLVKPCQPALLLAEVQRRTAPAIPT